MGEEGRLVWKSDVEFDKDIQNRDENGGKGVEDLRDRSIVGKGMEEDLCLTAEVA